jgi:small-conductance mechanosensitive channel
LVTVCVPDFAVEFWVNGIEDLTHKYVSDVLFVIWNTLKAEGIEMPIHAGSSKSNRGAYHE